MHKQGTVKRQAGRDLQASIARSLVKDYYAALLQLSCNSYDADARAVQIDIDWKKDTLTFSDDGHGMDQSGLASFFTMGDSDKATHLVSPGGRRYIGKYGIASVLLGYLAERYRIETWKDGRKMIVEDDGSGRSLEAIVSTADPKLHGTTITMQDLRFGKETFDRSKLISKLEWGLPSIPDFDLFVNNVLLEKRSIITYCTEYHFEEDIPSIGLVEGSVYYKENSPMNPNGILIYVNKCLVGDSQSIDLARIVGFAANRVLGIVQADGLERFVGFDRDGFRFDSPEYKATQKVIEKVLGSVAEDIRNYEGSRGYHVKDRWLTRSAQALRESEELLNDALVRMGSEPVKLAFAREDKNPLASWYDHDQAIIYINAASHLLSYPATHNPTASFKEVLKHSILLLAIDSIVDDELSPAAQKGSVRLAANTEKAAEIIFSGMRQLRDKVQDLVQGNASNAPTLSEAKLNRYRLYTLEELSYKHGIDINTMKRLYLCGALPAVREGTTKKCAAADILNCFREIDGFVPAAHLIDPQLYDRRFHIAHNADSFKWDQALMAHALPDYAKNVGSATRPFVWVRDSSVGEFIRTYGSEVKGHG
jgi:hypothetical protein